MIDSCELYKKLNELALLNSSPEYWWPNYGTFEVVIGAILTQNTQWKRVEISLNNLRKVSLNSLQSLANASLNEVMQMIKPCGFYQRKGDSLILLSQKILSEYETFEKFVQTVDREWLLRQKSIGNETADSILCYACMRPIMVVDSYTFQLVNSLSFEFESYEELQEWMIESIQEKFSENQLPYIYAKYHGMIVEYVKKYKKGKIIDVSVLRNIE